MQCLPANDNGDIFLGNTIYQYIDAVNFMKLQKRNSFIVRSIAGLASLVSIFSMVVACSSGLQGPSDAPASANDLTAFVKQSKCHNDKVAEQLAIGNSVSGKGLANIQNYCADLEAHASVLDKQHEAIKSLSSSSGESSDRAATDSEMVMLVKQSQCQAGKVADLLASGLPITASQIPKIEHLCRDSMAQALALKSQRDAMKPSSAR